MLLHTFFPPHDHEFHNSIDKKKICVIWRYVSKSTYVFNAINMLRKIFLVLLHVSYTSERKTKNSLWNQEVAYRELQVFGNIFLYCFSITLQGTRIKYIKRETIRMLLISITKYQPSFPICSFKLQALLLFLPFVLVEEIILH